MNKSREFQNLKIFEQIKTKANAPRSSLFNVNSSDIMEKLKIIEENGNSVKKENNQLNDIIVLKNFNKQESEKSRHSIDRPRLSLFFNNPLSPIDGKNTNSDEDPFAGKN